MLNHIFFGKLRNANNKYKIGLILNSREKLNIHVCDKLL